MLGRVDLACDAQAASLHLQIRVDLAFVVDARTDSYVDFRCTTTFSRGTGLAASGTVSSADDPSAHLDFIINLYYSISASLLNLSLGTFSINTK